MIARVTFGLSSPFALALALSACSEPQTVTSRIFSLPEEVQVHAQFGCQAELGIDSADSIDILRLKDGRSVVSTVDGRGLSLGQASAVNRCAQKRLLGEAHPVSYVIETPPSSVKERVPGTVYKPSSCKEGRSVLQGGTAICPGS